MGAEPQNRDVAWYDARPSESQLPQDARELLEKYSKIPADELENHVVKVREEAWDIFPYPCIGQFRFLDLSLKYFDEYPEVLKRLQEGQKLLDMACCFGQEIRQLVADGAPAENIYGCDLREEYIALGYKLFADRDTLKANFLTANIFDATSSLTERKGTFNVIYTGSFFHLFDYDDQVKVSKAVASLLLPEKNSLILGRQVGSTIAAEHDHRTNPTGKMFRHNIESLKEMWKKIGDDIGVSFAVDARLEELDSGLRRFHTSDTRRIWFTIRRL
jgi:2-polyprenyl-3-methyl-5-hydroxy-6-metoxy-1,4-benzoquinol methylase